MELDGEGDSHVRMPLQRHMWRQGRTCCYAACRTPCSACLIWGAAHVVHHLTLGILTGTRVQCCWGVCLTQLDQAELACTVLGPSFTCYTRALQQDPRDSGPTVIHCPPLLLECTCLPAANVQTGVQTSLHGVQIYVTVVWQIGQQYDDEGLLFSGEACHLLETCCSHCRSYKLLMR